MTGMGKPLRKDAMVPEGTCIVYWFLDYGGKAAG